MDWARILAYIIGTVDQELLLRNEYLAAENRILKAQLQGRLRLSDAERVTLGEIGHRLGRKALGEVATLGWYRKLVARKFDGSRARRAPGRPPIGKEIEELIIRMAKENRSWGYDRIVGALANLGHQVSDQTVGNVLRRHGIPPATERRGTTTWAEFIRAHLAVLAGTDSFHGGGPRAARTGDLLYPVLYPFGEPKGGDRRDHHPPDRAVDDANGSERHHARKRRPLRQPLSPSRSRHEVHSFLPGNH